MRNINPTFAANKYERKNQARNITHPPSLLSSYARNLFTFSNCGSRSIFSSQYYLSSASRPHSLLLVRAAFFMRYSCAYFTHAVFASDEAGFWTNAQQSRHAAPPLRSASAPRIFSPFSTKLIRTEPKLSINDVGVLTPLATWTSQCDDSYGADGDKSGTIFLKFCEFLRNSRPTTASIFSACELDEFP